MPHGPLDALKKATGIRATPRDTQSLLKNNPYAQALNIDNPSDITPMAGTTVGPGAIPLSNYGDYIRRAAEAGLKDLRSSLLRIGPETQERARFALPAMRELSGEATRTGDPRAQELLHQNLIRLLSEVTDR